MIQDQVDIKTPEFVSLSFQLAGVGSRAAAFIIDQFILIAADLLIAVVFLFLTDGLSSITVLSENSFPLAIGMIVLFILNWGYFFVLEYFSGGKTLGKRMIGIRVIQENGHSITLLSSFIRNLLRIIDTLPAFYLLGLVMVFFHPKHKRLGDLASGTIVVHERKAKRKNKVSALEKEIKKRGITKEDVAVNEWTMKSIGMKEWKLVSTYAARFTQLPDRERTQLTQKIAGILFAKINLEMEGKSEQDLENILLSLYLTLRDEWEFEI